MGLSSITPLTLAGTLTVYALCCALLLAATAALAQQGAITTHPLAPPSQNGQVDLNIYAIYLSGSRIGAVLVEAPVRVNRFLSVAPAVVRIDSPVVTAGQIRGSATGSLPVKRFVIEDRNLFLRQFTQGQQDTTLYRNRLVLARPLSFRRRHMRLFAFEEVFYDWRVRAWIRHWSSAGGSVDLGKHLRVEAYYSRQVERGSSGRNVIVYSLAIRLPNLTGRRN